MQMPSNQILLNFIYSQYEYWLGECFDIYMLKLMDAWGKMDFFYCKVSISHIICQCHLGPYVISQLERHLLVDLLHVRKTLNTFNRRML